ncbi:unnamed protein product [Knipowitschia caucasica]
MTRRCLLLLGLVLILDQTWSQLDLSQSKEELDQDLDLDQRPEQDLVSALQLILGQIHSAEKRSIPVCGMGDRCALKFGPRIGKLCDCGRGANCNSYLLKCI